MIPGQASSRKRVHHYHDINIGSRPATRGSQSLVNPLGENPHGYIKEQPEIHRP